ncbi:hypothetical protein DL98DRAFT_576403 [Cadophora sp. DSE1049]|nr:hypothetical protein DL98DRAFT_576403 [Cadophora sp. DSE1049]
MTISSYSQMGTRKIPTQKFNNHHQIVAEASLVTVMDLSICHSHIRHQGKGLQLRADIVGDVRCSGSGENVQGRCKNCQRFQQDCIFVPVSPYVQAFVPAHLAYPQMPNMGVNSDGGVHLLIPGQQRYGAYGQPLSQITPTTADLGSYAAVPPKELSSDFADETIGGSRKRRHIELHPSILPPPPFPGQFHHGQISAKRPATEANLLLDTTTPAARLGLQQTPIRSPKPYVSSNSELPNILLSMSQSRIPPPNSYPSERLHPIASVNIDSRASEIDRYMLGRLDGKKD